MIESLNNLEKMEERVYSYPTSAIKMNNVKINYYHFLMNVESNDFLDSLYVIYKYIGE